ncbi:MAG: FHA domain-containing protein [Clostridiales bacterium]|nr:FHA domain-containing protein [Clostridiales bacterium]
MAFIVVSWSIWILSLIGNIYLARKKNRNVVKWVVLSIFFSWITLIANACMKPEPSSGNVGGTASGGSSGSPLEHGSAGGPADSPSYHGSAGSMSSGGHVRGLSGVMMGQSYPVGGGLSIGRDVSSGLRFPNETKGISRTHCRIYPDGSGGFLIMDYGSTFGTFLKGYGKLSPQKPVPIRPGDVFYLGNGNEGFVFEQ